MLPPRRNREREKEKWHVACDSIHHLLWKKNSPESFRVNAEQRNYRNIVVYILRSLCLPVPSPYKESAPRKLQSAWASRGTPQNMHAQGTQHKHKTVTLMQKHIITTTKQSDGKRRTRVATRLTNNKPYKLRARKRIARKRIAETASCTTQNRRRTGCSVNACSIFSN